MEIDRSTYEENENIQHWDKIKMSSMGDLLNRKPKEKKAIKYTKEESFLMSEIYEWSVSIGTPIKNFNMIYNFMATKGIQWVRQCWEETKHFSFPYQNVGTFINKVKDVKIIFK